MSNFSYSGYSSGGLLGGPAAQFGGFWYGAGISIGILLIITTIILASYYCTREEEPSSSTAAALEGRNHPVGPPDPEYFVAVDVGLDDETIKSYPKLLYSEAKLKTSDHATDAGCCSICLADYKASDELRQLPECGHLFHWKCIGPWLRLHPTCPFCRTSPLPTPLAEVAPLARSGGN